jgi:hypothetical protein
VHEANIQINIVWNYNRKTLYGDYISYFNANETQIALIKTDAALTQQIENEYQDQVATVEIVNPDK